jgi:HEAT repeat protein
LHKAGKLNEVQERFWQEKPAEELYDLSNDPDEVKNLADSPDHKDVLARMRGALRGHLLAIRDNGFIPEGSPLEGFVPTRDEAAYPLAKILDFADVVTRRDAANVPQFVQGLTDANEVMRYWAALGCLLLRDKAAPAKAALLTGLADASPHVRVVAAEALCHLGEGARGLAVLGELLTKDASAKVRLQAANALDHLGAAAKPALGALRAATKDDDDYVKRAVRYTAAVLAGEEPPGEGD